MRAILSRLVRETLIHRAICACLIDLALIAGGAVCWRGSLISLGALCIRFYSAVTATFWVITGTSSIFDASR